MEEFKGRVTGIIFQRDAFAIAKFRPYSDKNEVLDEIVFVGNVPPAMLRYRGMLELFGEWEQSKFGPQLKVASIQRPEPINASELKSYLVDSIAGIGPKRAEAIYKHFGERLFEILEKEPERLAEVKGITAESAQRISENWAADKVNRALRSLLSSVGLANPEWAQKITRQLGPTAESIIRGNPYRLIDVPGIGFKKADEVARALGYGLDSEDRARGVILFLLQKCADEGHVYLQEGELLYKCQKECQLARPLAETTLNKLLAEERTVRGRAPESQIVRFIVQKGTMQHPCIYLRRYFEAENELLESLKRLSATHTLHDLNGQQIEHLITRAEESLGIRLNDKQRLAVKKAIEEPVSILTGRPGSGKTTALKVIVEIAHQRRARLELCAPTGRAAKRMMEVTNAEAVTIHRLLEYSARFNGFERDSANPLDCDLLIVDECSMIDISLAAALLDAVSVGCHVLFVGDPNQLPSVGAGSFLQDMIASNRVPFTELTEIFRQAQQSLIVQNAHRILAGQLPVFYPEPRDSGPPLYDCHRMNAPLLEDSSSVDAEWMKNALRNLMLNSFPNRLQLDPIRDIQVLVPQKKGPCGVIAVNEFLQNILNPRPDSETAQIGHRQYRLGDRVMQTKNDLKRNVYNGDIGFIVKIDHEDEVLTVNFDGQESIYKFEETGRLQIAYASTVHKAQGSEYPAVILILLKEHFTMLQRQLLYTATTRGKRMLVYLTQKGAMEIAVQRTDATQRNSLLAVRLQKTLPRKEHAA